MRIKGAYLLKGYQSPLASDRGVIRDGRTARLVVATVLLLVAAACAPKRVPPPPTTLAHPEFLYPSVPAPLQKTFAAEHVDLGWRYLQIDVLRGALAAFDAALKVDPSLTDVRRRAEVLRFRGVQALIETARAAAKAGRMSDARTAYGQAIAASPESAFLYRELGVIERRAGNVEQSLTALRRATELDPLDSLAFVQLAEVLESRLDFAAAAAAYRTALDLDPSPELEERLATVTKNAREAQLPPEYRTALDAAQITRGDLAAIIGVRLESIVKGVPARQVVVTDMRNHWAAPWIALVAAAGVMPPFENHTFQPNAAVRRGDLAVAISRLLTIVASNNSALRARLSQRPAIADMNRRHVQYTAAAAVVSSGVMPLLEGDRFQVGRAVSGGEAVDVVDRVGALSAQTANAGL
jgi:tetratricopeptide (TPR) repeat protein